MTHNKNQIAQLLNTASAIKANDDAIIAGKSAKNTFSWQVAHILHNGFLQDKQALERMVKKGGELFHCRSYVSKAKTVLSALESGIEIEVKDAPSYTFDMFKESSFDNVPEVTLSSLYTSVKKAEKNADTLDTIKNHAYMILEERTGQTISQLQEAAPEAFDSLLDGAMAEAAAALQAEAAKVDAVAQAKALIDSLNPEQVNIVANYILDKVNTDTVKAA